MKSISSTGSGTRSARLIGALCVALIGRQASAASISQPAAPFTDLSLSASASVSVAPDVLVADVSATWISPDPVTAQRHVNTLMALATKTARTENGIETDVENYSVGQDDSAHPRWTAQQSIELRAKDGDALLALVGQLQTSGLTLDSLGWQLSDQASQAANQAATLAALRQLRADAADEARVLDLTVDHYQQIRVGSDQTFSPYAPRVFTAAMANAAMPAPQATAQQQKITVQVSADVMLRPAP